MPRTVLDLSIGEVLFVEFSLLLIQLALKSVFHLLLFPAEVLEPALPFGGLLLLDLFLEASALLFQDQLYLLASYRYLGFH